MRAETFQNIYVESNDRSFQTLAFVISSELTLFELKRLIYL